MHPEHMSHVFGFPTRSDTNRAVQPQRIVRGLKFRISEIEGLYYLCSKNKGPDQLCSYCTADLPLCFRICKKLVLVFVCVGGGGCGGEELQIYISVFFHYVTSSLVVNT